MYSFESSSPSSEIQLDWLR
uniref:Uncharacterized protein n=1 Tax=Arundo donax TaxID=35708 RepID=A0A0A8YI37_ARUDO